MQLPFTIVCAPPFLTCTFSEPQKTLSWALNKPGFHTLERIAWLEVRNKDLPIDVDFLDFVAAKLGEAQLSDALALVTSRDIRRYHVTQANVEGAIATCLTTVGLSNGERIGTRSTSPVPLPGTVNTLVHVSQPLSEAALLETLSVVTQARTAAILDSAVLRDGQRITGTGTDCIVVAAPPGAYPNLYAGLHTPIGEAVGRCTYDAIRAGAETWERDFASICSAGAAATAEQMKSG